MPDIIGQSIGRYHIIEQLGQGGMAVVYKAFDTSLNCNVAVKIIRQEKITPESAPVVLKRFENEARKTARLSHPNIIPVTDYGNYNNTPFLVMKYITGGTLKHLVGKPIPYQEAAKLLTPIADALSYAHEHGVIHRDVKPANILITESGQPMLSDFGVAKIQETQSETSESLTINGIGVGTPEYMAPEQANGKGIDARADIYALGVVFYELVTGRKPFTADTPLAVIIKQSTDPLPRPKLFVPDLPDEVENIIFKALARKPEGRFQTMSEFASELARVSIARFPKKPARTNLPGLDQKPEEIDQTQDISLITEKSPAKRSRSRKIRGSIIICLGALLIGTLAWMGYKDNWIKISFADPGAYNNSSISTKSPTVKSGQSAPLTPQGSRTTPIPPSFQKLPVNIFIYNTTGTIYQVNDSDGSIIDQTDISGEVIDLKFNPRNQLLYVAIKDTTHIDVVHISPLEVKDQIFINNNIPICSINISNNGMKLVVSTGDETMPNPSPLQIISTVDNELLKRIENAKIEGCSMAAFSFNDQQLFVLWQDNVMIYSATDYSQRKEYIVRGWFPDSFKLSSNGTSAFIVQENSAVNWNLATMNLNSITMLTNTSDSPDLEVSSDESIVWITTNNGISEYDKDLQLIQKINTDKMPVSIQLSPDGSVLYILTADQLLTLDAYSGELTGSVDLPIENPAGLILTPQ